MRRHSFLHDKIVFSYLDNGGGGEPLLVLHGHWMGASDFEDFAGRIGDKWRVIALDQRGFGETDHTDRHSLDAYVNDAVAVLDKAGVTDPVSVLGHSFGGVVAYHLAAIHPGRVKAMIIEDIGVVLDDDALPFVTPWAGTFRLREELEDKLGPRLSPYLQKSIQRVDDGWRLNFEPEEFLASEQAINGDHWAIWLKSRCPALVVSGSQSRVADGAHLREMADRRMKTDFLQLNAGHSVHIDAPEAFADNVAAFLHTAG